MSIALSIGNNLTTNGVFTSSAVNNTSVTNVTDFASVPGGGVLKLLSSQTASASATISFTSGIDSTYDSYVFTFNNIHSSAISKFTFNGSIDGGSNYNVVKTTTVFDTYHYENDGGAELHYDNDGTDLAQSTAFQSLTEYNQNADNDCSTVGNLHLFNPSSTTFVKHFISESSSMFTGGVNRGAMRGFVAGYMNTTSAVNAIQFKMSSGNIDSGIIKMYGVK